MSKLPQIPGYVSFDELEHYLTQNISAIAKGDEHQRARNVGLALANGGKIDTSLIESRGRASAFHDMLNSLKNWRVLDSKMSD